IGDLVLFRTHYLSNADKNFTAKFAPKFKGPYLITGNPGPFTFQLEGVDTPSDTQKAHARDLKLYQCPVDAQSQTQQNSPIVPVVSGVSKTVRPKRQLRRPARFRS